MKVSELIKVLNIIEEKHGDNEIHISVRDYYSVYGSFATIDLKTNGSMWQGIRTSNKITTLDVHLENDETFEGQTKYPKVTYRKAR